MPPFDGYARRPAGDRPNIAEHIQAKNSFDWFYSPESGLFNRLRRFQAKKLAPVSGDGRNVSDRIVLAFSALP
jgi:hypothetical protein